MNTKILAGSIVVGALIIGGMFVFSQGGSQTPETFQYVKGVPCHSMGDYWMGDCQFDKDGNPTNI